MKTKIMKLFSGTSNPKLAKAVAGTLGVPLGNVEITRFIDNECRVFVKDEVTNEDAFVLQSLSEVADQNLVELCLVGQALKSLGVRNVTAVIPWLGYSKQDKAFRRGEAISIQLVSKFIEVAGFDAVITCELHSREVLKYFHIPVIELSTHKLLADTLQGESRPGLEHMVVVSPDKGGKSRSERFASEVGLDIVYLTKSRDLESGNVTVTDIKGSVRDKSVIFFDDIINTGATAVQTSQFVKAQGAKKVYFLATHAVLAGDASHILSKSTIDHVIVTDTVAIPREKMFDKLTVISMASLLADAIVAQTK